jgi:hypothetical protein
MSTVKKYEYTAAAVAVVVFIMGFILLVARV